MPVVQSVSSNLSASLPYIAVKVDRAKAAAAGLSEQQVGGIVTQAMNPSATGTIVIDEKTLSIYVKNPDAPTTQAELKDFSIPTLKGPVALSSIATVGTVDGPSSITTIKGAAQRDAHGRAGDGQHRQRIRRGPEDDRRDHPAGERDRLAGRRDRSAEQRVQLSSGSRCSPPS